MERLEELVRQQVREHLLQYHNASNVKIMKPEVLRVIEDDMVSSALTAIMNAAPRYLSATQKELDRTHRIYELTNLVSRIIAHLLQYSWVRGILSLFNC
jgi:hypothetical protein